MGNFKDVAVIDVLVKPGDTVVIDSPLVTLESDKATMDVPSTAVGVVEKLHTNKGGKVNTGDLIATVRANGSAPVAAPLATATPATVPPATATPATALPSRSAAAPPPTPRGVSPAAAPERASAPEAGAALAAAVATTLRSDLAPIDEPGFSRAHAGPSVRKFARELGVDLARVTGQGFKGRITHDDVKAFVKIALASGTDSARPALPAVSRVAYHLDGLTTID